MLDQQATNMVKDAMFCVDPSRDTFEIIGFFLNMKWSISVYKLVTRGPSSPTDLEPKYVLQHIFDNVEGFGIAVKIASSRLHAN